MEHISRITPTRSPNRISWKRCKRACLSLAILFLPITASAADDGVTISHAWSPPSLSQPNSVGFMNIISAAGDALIGAKSDCCTAVELHTHIMDGDVVRMRKVDKINLPAGEEVQLRPRSYHLMMIGLREPLQDGASVDVELQFEHAPSQKVTLPVSRAELLKRLDTPHGNHH